MGLYLSFDFQSAADMAVLLVLPIHAPDPRVRAVGAQVEVATDNRFER